MFCADSLRMVISVFICFKVDCKELVDRIYGPLAHFSEVGATISDCNNILLSFPNFTVKFVKRQPNMAAHSLAWGIISYVVVTHITVYLHVFLPIRWMKSVNLVSLSQKKCKVTTFLLRIKQVLTLFFNIRFSYFRLSFSIYKPRQDIYI